MPKLLQVGGYGIIKATNIARTFFEAAGIVDATQKLAIQKLIYNLCNFGLWDKIIALYPMVGGTALSHSINLKNCVNNNLTFLGGWVHSETGAKPNGVNAYANMNIKPNDFRIIHDGSPANRHYCYYAGTAPPAGVNTVLLGTTYSVGGDDFISPAFGTVITSSSLLGGLTLKPTGLYFAARNQNDLTLYFRNRLELRSRTTVSTVLVGILDFYLAAYNSQGTTLWYASEECRFASIGLSMTLEESTVYMQILDDFQTALNRAI